MSCIMGCLEEELDDALNIASERVVVLEQKNKELKEKIEKYERWMVGSIKQLGDPAFLLTYQSGSQLIKEIRQSMSKLLYE